MGIHVLNSVAYHSTSDGRVIPLKKLTTPHLFNILNYLPKDSTELKWYLKELESRENRQPKEVESRKYKIEFTFTLEDPTSAHLYEVKSLMAGLKEGIIDYLANWEVFARNSKIKFLEKKEDPFEK